MADNNLTPQSYEQVRQQELTGTGIASPNGPSWAAQQAYSKQQEQQAAAAAKRADVAAKARANWKQPTSNGGKRGR